MKRVELISQKSIVPFAIKAYRSASSFCMKVISGESRVCKVNSEEMVTDILTKALPHSANIKCYKGLKLVFFEAKTG